jgi:hypothetical protein
MMRLISTLRVSMKYFIISVAVAGICLSVLPGKPSAGSHTLANDKAAGVCVANLFAGNACQPAAQLQPAQSQQKYVLVRGQLLPL